MTFVFEDPKRGSQRNSALAVSLLLHAVVILVALNAPGYSIPARAPSEFTQKIETRDSKLVWYKFRKELPPVIPVRKRLEKQPLRAEVKAPQAIVSSPKDAPKRPQMVWTPAPELTPVAPVESPNILAVKLAPKQFIAPPPAGHPDRPKAQIAPEAPPLAAHAGPTPDRMPDIKLPPKVYVAPPPPARSAVARLIEPLDAPQMSASAATSAGGPAFPATRLPPRPFTAPPAGHGVAESKTTAIESAPSLDLPANSADLNVAIVGLNPLDKMIPPPSASSRADFSAGPKPRATGASSEGTAAGVTVPDLFVRGARVAPKPDLIAEAYASPTSATFLRGAMRAAGPPALVHEAPSAPAHSPGSARVSSAPDPRFNGRDVYMMAIQMPNLTSYSGSWLMWYSSRTVRETGLEPISAPVPHRKVDPKYVATAVEERIEGKVRLACVIDREGRVSAVELVRGLDERLNESARDALSKWIFYPAMRNGSPVEVDVLVEIPFRLAPRVVR
ncbi:MAG: TonB family protein [Terriglobia bacterium]